MEELRGLFPISAPPRVVLLGQNVREIQRIIEGGRFKVAGERHKRRKPAGFREPADDADLGGVGKSRQRMKPTRGNAVGRRKSNPKTADFFHAVQCSNQLGSAPAIGSLAQPVEQRLVSAFRD